MTSRLGSLDVYPPASKFAYFDAASVGLMHKGAAQSIVQWQKALAEEGTVAFNEQDELQILEGLGQAAAKLFGTDEQSVAISSGETPLMASLAWAVAPPKGSTIVATDVCHPSTIYPWMRVAETTGAELRWARGKNYYVAPESIEALIDDNTAVVCLSHAEYGTGQVHDLKHFADLAHKHGALLVVDTTQSAGQIPIDAQSQGFDAAVSSTYKWTCGPFGTGVMYVSPELQQANPGIIGWRSHNDMWDFQADRVDYPDTAKRFEYGTMAYGTALGAAEAINHLLNIGIDTIASHNRTIADELWAGLEETGAEILSPADTAQRSATVAARFPGQDSRELAAALKQRSVVSSLRRDFIRFSPHLYNNSEDVETALSALRDSTR
ncbi:MAG: aminotransferase class V-fold PLP-dependent enzyme [Pseudomonadota bacterium]